MIYEQFTSHILLLLHSSSVCINIPISISKDYYVPIEILLITVPISITRLLDGIYSSTFSILFGLILQLLVYLVFINMPVPIPIEALLINLY